MVFLGALVVDALREYPRKARHWPPLDLINTPRYMDFRIFKGRILGFKVLGYLKTVEFEVIILQL